ncbi:helix-turn-helix transcriptional regulator [Rickettsiella massiliensis]|uniref:helix-turn-helix transcriptional regulator n=1 Tax=Rickettsiella massiliensis TaxID=676517 RepID=UPI00029B009C|nr:helix-turn-helix transcriptional regulator [Rickettsiella massiliensis]
MLYDELARDYLLYLGNRKPSNNQLVVFKKLITDVISNCLFTFPDKLTLQEMKCLYLSFKGKSIAHAAEILEIHPDTVKYYRKRSIRKLGCKNMVEAAFKCTGTHFQNDLCDKLITQNIRHIKVYIQRKVNSL